ncbi:hypothetical protein SERLA73DRAFT_43697, partial [Serpula lacrymans var. lacrymans S7.3]
IPFLVTSATFTPDMLNDSHQLLQIHSDQLLTVDCSTDHPNISIGVKKIEHPLTTYLDLAFLIPSGWKACD